MREPCIAWWPGAIKPASVSQELSCTMDVFVTSLELAGSPVPDDRIIDGVSMSPILLADGKSQRELMFYYRGTRLMAVRKGPWKAHFITQAGYREKPTQHDPPLLFHLEHDPSEQYDAGKNHPDVIVEVLREVEQHRANLKPAKSQLELLIAKK